MRPFQEPSERDKAREFSWTPALFQQRPLREVRTSEHVCARYLVWMQRAGGWPTREKTLPGMGVELFLK
jgi:hypothetical protein